MRAFNFMYALEDVFGLSVFISSRCLSLSLVINMQDAINWINCVNWSILSQVFSAGATVALAVIAWVGLKTWKEQIHAQVKTEFVDEFIKAIGEYITAISIPVQIIQYIEFDIKSCADFARHEGKNGENDGLIEFIKKNGEKRGRYLSEHLESTRPIRSKIQGLMVKGNVIFGKKEFMPAYEASMKLISSFNYINGFATVIANPNLFWENQRVQETLSSYRDIKASEIEKNLEENSSRVFGFCEDHFKDLFT